MHTKHIQMLDIIAIWKQKASEQGHFWGLQLNDLKAAHQRSCNNYKA